MIFACDTETTGLLVESNDFLAQPGIVQIGAVRCGFMPWEGPNCTGSEWREDCFLDTLINPERAKWEEGAIKTHGIHPEHVQNAPTFFAIFDQLAQMAEGCDTWLGYNTSFDKAVLYYQLQRYGFERHFPWPRKEVDVMRLARNHMAMQGKRGNKDPKLTEIYDELFHQSFEAHDALADIRATVRVFQELTK